MCAAAGCAGNDTRTVAGYEQEMTLARAAVQRAEESGAYEHGAAEFNAARDKLVQAEEAIEEGEPELAMRLVREANLDAELAAARADNAQAQTAVEELRASIETLRRELEGTN
jgi:hypothetical protein